MPELSGKASPASRLRCEQAYPTMIETCARDDEQKSVDTPESSPVDESVASRRPSALTMSGHFEFD